MVEETSFEKRGDYTVLLFEMCKIVLIFASDWYGETGSLRRPSEEQLTTPPHTVPWSRNRGALPPLPHTPTGMFTSVLVIGKKLLPLEQFFGFITPGSTHSDIQCGKLCNVIINRFIPIIFLIVNHRFLRYPIFQTNLKSDENYGL